MVERALAKERVGEQRVGVLDKVDESDIGDFTDEDWTIWRHTPMLQT